MKAHETNNSISEYEVIKNTQDHWNNPVQVIRINNSRCPSYFMDKVYANANFSLPQQKRDLLIKLIKGLSHPFLQAANIKQNASYVNVIYDYDFVDFKTYVEYTIRKKKLISENQLLIICKALIDLGALFENYFCFIPEISLKTLKIFRITDDQDFECGLRLQNPFINDEYMMEIIEVGL